MAVVEPSTEGTALSPPVAADAGDVLARSPGPLNPGSEVLWIVDLSDRRGGTARLGESLAAVADGLVGTRAHLEEDGTESVPFVYVAGAYVPAEGTVQATMELPSWALLEFRELPAPGRRVLDLRDGVLWRTCVDEHGEVEFRSARWACLGRPGTEVLVAEADTRLLRVADQGEDGWSRTRPSPFGVTVTETGHDEWDDDGASVRLVRVVSFGVEEDDGRPSSLSARHVRARRAGAATLLDEQHEAWGERWARSDIEVVGDAGLTRALRLALFHLHASAADGDEAAVGARGLTGPGYAGHVFWDADVFVIPVLAATHPAAARSMLRYRLHRLDAARARAVRSGRQGARFPWESAADGTDVTPRSGVNELGQRVPILTGALEEHITADVAWAACHVAAFVGDAGLLRGELRPLVVETARYWASRVRLDPSGTAHIDHVIGPDEYHEDVDDNAYTNVMAAWNLRAGADLLSEPSGGPGPGELAEARRWREVADALVTGYDPATGRHEQFRHYDRLQPLTVEALGTVPAAADVILGRDRLAGSQIIKQADVVMLHHLVPDAMPDGSLAHDLAWYLPRTAHGSTLSPAVHASVLARAGRLREALHWLDVAARIDVDDLTGTTAGGVHLAAMGGLWQAVVFGFAGLRAGGPDEGLVLDPHLPGEWDELRVSIEWRGAPVTIRCRHDAVHVACVRHMAVTLDGRREVVEPPGRWLGLGGER